LSSDTTSAKPCQVDFYLLEESSPQPASVACRLALMAWERQQKVFIITSTETTAEQLDEQMWQQPEGRFLPHTRAGSQDSSKAAVNIGLLSALNLADVVINLCPEAVPQPERFSRILEIVPFVNNEREASRVKYRTYRDLGITPHMQEISTPKG
jgi:DNA polymerase-3 subunit chi